MTDALPPAADVLDMNVLKVAFRNPELTAPTPIRVRPDGTLSGHLATWLPTHPMVATPRSTTGYAAFHRTPIQTTRGPLRVGTILMDVPGDGHQGESPVAYVRVGEDEHGIWLAGLLIEARPGVPVAGLLPDKVRGGDELAAWLNHRYRLSGQWQGEGDVMELVAVTWFEIPPEPGPVDYARLAQGLVPATDAGGEIPGLYRSLTTGALHVDRDHEEAQALILALAQELVQTTGEPYSCAVGWVPDGQDSRVQISLGPRAARTLLDRLKAGDRIEHLGGGLMARMSGSAPQILTALGIDPVRVDPVRVAEGLTRLAFQARALTQAIDKISDRAEDPTQHADVQSDMAAQVDRLMGQMSGVLLGICAVAGLADVEAHEEGKAWTIVEAYAPGPASSADVVALLTSAGYSLGEEA